MCGGGAGGGLRLCIMAKDGDDAWVCEVGPAAQQRWRMVGPTPCPPHHDSFLHHCHPLLVDMAKAARNHVIISISRFIF